MHERPLTMEWLEGRLMLAADWPGPDIAVQQEVIELLIEPGDTLSGNRKLLGNVINRGMLSPGNSPGIIEIAGDLTIDASDESTINDDYAPAGADTVGTIEIEIGGLNPGPGIPEDDGYDQIRVDGNVTLGGHLQIDLINDFVPQVGDTFDIITFDGSQSGLFESAAGDTFGLAGLPLYFGIQVVPREGGGGTVQLEVKELESPTGRPTIAEVEEFLSAPLAPSTFSFRGDLSVPGFVDLSGSFSVTKKSDGSQVTIGAQVDAFLGTGRETADPADDVGLELRDANLGAVLFTPSEGPRTYAVSASGDVAFVGLDGLDIDGSVAIQINNTGLAISQTVPVPTGDDVAIEFAGSDDVMAIQGSVEFALANVFGLSGQLNATKTRSGSVLFDIQNMDLGIQLHGEPVFGLGGGARFTIGGNDGFRLLDMGLNSVTVYGVTLDASSGILPDFQASENGDPADGFAVELTSLPGLSVDANLLNRRRYIDVTYFAPAGMDVAASSILDESPEFELTGEGVVDARVGAVVRLAGDTFRYFLEDGDEANEDSLFKPGTVEIHFLGQSWQAESGERADAQDFEVTVRAGTATSTKPMVAGPLSITGPRIGIEDFQFKVGGDPNLTIAIGIGAAKAALDFGDTQESSDVTVELLDLLGTFELGIHVTTGGLEIRNGAFGFEVGELEAIVPDVVTVTASGVGVHYDPKRDAGYKDREIIRVESASIEIPKVDVTGSIGPYTRPDGTEIPGLSVRNNGFGLGTAMLTKGDSINLGGILKLQGVSAGVTDFGVTFGEAVDFDGEIFFAAHEAELFPDKSFTATVKDANEDGEAVRCALTFTDAKVDGFKFAADQLELELGSYLAVTGSNILIDTSAAADEEVASFASLGAKLNAGPLRLSGEMRNFAFLGNGDFETKDGFGVFFNRDTADSKAFKWPSWLPIRITSVGAHWENINVDPLDFQVTVSAALTGLHNLPLKVSGAVEGLVIDVGLLLEGKFPIVAMESLAVGVEGKLFGGDVKGSLLGGIVRFDRDGNVLAADNSTTPVEDRVLFVGLDAGFTMAGVGGFGLKMAFSELGPLGVMLTASTPTGILLEPTSGLSINDFVAGVEFFESLPVLTEPQQLRDASLDPVAEIDPDAWLASVKDQVVDQYLAIQSNPNRAGFLAAFNEPMTITAGAKIYSQYTSQYAFNGQVELRLSTDGKFLATGKLNFFDGALSTDAKLYANLSEIAQGNASVLLLADIPDEFRFLVIEGKFQMQFQDDAGQSMEFDFADPDDSLLPVAHLARPTEGSTIGLETFRGRGYLDVSYWAKNGRTIVGGSVTDDEGEFRLQLSDGTALTIGDTPTLVSEPGANPATYRYTYSLPAGADLVPGEVKIQFVEGSFADSNTQTNKAETDTFHLGVPAAELLLPTNGGQIDQRVLNSVGSITVRFRTTPGATLDLDSLLDGAAEIQLSGAAAQHVILSGAPTQIDDSTLFQYAFTGAFDTGPVQVTYLPGSFVEIDAVDEVVNSSVETEQSFLVAGPTAQLLDRSVDVVLLNERGYLDVQFDASFGATLVASSLTDPDAEFTLSGSAANGITVKGMPTNPSGDGVTWRYTFEGQFQPGEISLDFAAGAWRDTLDAVVLGNVAASETLTVLGPTIELISPQTGVAGVGLLNLKHYLDVKFRPTWGSTLDESTVLDSAPELSLSGSAVSAEVPVEVQGAPEPLGEGVYRYRFSDDLHFQPGELRIEFAAGAVEDQTGYASLGQTQVVTLVALTAGLAYPVAGSRVAASEINDGSRRYLDVSFADPLGVGLNEASITDSDPEIEVWAKGDNGDDFQISVTGVTVGDGFCRYALGGDLPIGPVTVKYLAGSWTDMDGNLGSGGEQSFVVTPTAANLSLEFVGAVDLYGGTEDLRLMRISGGLMMNAHPQGVEAFAAGEISIGPPALGFRYGGQGVLVITDDGFAAEVAIWQSFDLGFFLEFDAQAHVTVNTTEATQSVEIPDDMVPYLPPRTRDSLTGPNERTYVIPAGAPHRDGTTGDPGAYVVLGVEGNLTIADTFQMSGDFWVEVSEDQFLLDAAASLQLGSFGQLSAAGNLIVDSSGVRARVAVDGTLGMEGIWSIECGGRLEVNTTEQDWTIHDPENGDVSVDANSLRVEVRGELDLLSVLTFSGGATIDMTDGEFLVTIDMGVDFFGIGWLDAAGSFNSEGEYSIDVAGGVNLGVAGCGLFGRGRLEISYEDNNGTALGGDGNYVLDVDANFNVRAELFHVTLASAGVAFNYDPITGRMSAKTTVKFILWSKSYTFYVGYMKTPPPANLAKNDDGTLYLNMGDDRASLRTRNPDEIDEAFTVEYRGWSEEHGHTVRVRAFGTWEDHDRVTRIIADGGSGIDTIRIQSDEPMPVPVVIHGGDGDDFFEITAFASQAEVDGGLGDDRLVVVGDDSSQDLRVSLDADHTPWVRLHSGDSIVSEVQLANVRIVSLSGADGADRFSVSGELDLAGVKGVVVDLGHADGDLDEVQLTLSDDHDVFELVPSDVGFQGLWKNHFTFDVVGGGQTDGDTVDIDARTGDDKVAAYVDPANRFAAASASEPYYLKREGNPVGLAYTFHDIDPLTEIDALVVDTANDENDGDFSPGDLSLREAIARTNTDGDSTASAIFFAPHLAGSTITLTLGHLSIDDNLTIAGPSANRLTVKAARNRLVFSVNNEDPNTTVNVGISTLSLVGSGATGGNGGGIFNRENLSLQDCDLVSHWSYGDGGAIYSEGSLTLVDSRIVASKADYNDNNTGSGGAIFSAGTLTVVGSTIEGSWSGGHGGGVYLGPAGVGNVVNSTISGNNADGHGGGIENLGTLSVVNSTISGNRSDVNNNNYGDGGGIYSSNTLTVIGSTISGNRSYNNAGGILAESTSTTTLSDSTIAGNSADGHSGGILNRGTLSVVNSVIRDNEADVNHSGSGDGGGIYNVGPLSIENTTIAGNRAYEYGGGIVNGGTLKLLGSTIASNFASYHGGGIHNSSYGTAKVHNSTIFDNSCGYSGGGIINWGVLSAVSSTIANNIADSNSNGTGGGGGIRTPSGSTTLHNTIVADNTVGSTADDLNGLVQTVSSYNLIGGNAATAGGLTNGVNGNKVGIDPLLDPAGLQNHGGLTQIVGLLPNSPAIDAGRNDLAVDANGDPLEFDQRGAARIYGAAVDIGAYEVQLVVTTAEDENDGVLVGGVSLRELIEWTNASPGADTINFAPGLAGNTISLDLGQLQITDDLTINGLGADQLTISGQGVTGIFLIDNDNVTTTIHVEIRGLSLVDAKSDYGAGILNREHLIVDACLLADNSAISGGGIHNTDSGTATIINSTLVGNTASNDGGGLATTGAVTIINSTLVGNSATDDGGAILSYGTLAVTNSTFADNRSEDLGGGVFSSGTLVLANSLFGNNTAASSGPEVYSSGAITARNNILQNGEGSGITSVDGNQVGTDPMLDPAGLQDHGGPTQTIALLPGSPAIDAGDNAAASDLTTDQRGVPYVRTYGLAVDVGAYEVQFVVDTTEDESDGDFSPGDLSLREAIELTNATPGADTITIVPGLTGSTITLTLGELVITEDLVIAGQQITLDANGGSRVIRVQSGADATIRNVTITGGIAVNGGGVLNEGELTIVNTTISDNTATGTYGGGIYSLHGAVTIENSTIANNSSNSHAGGIANLGGTLVVVNSTIADNTAEESGGGIVNWMGGTLNVTNATIVGNTADSNGDASGLGGGIDTTGEGVNVTTLHNTIVAENVRGALDSQTADDLSGTVAAGSSHNLIGDAASSGGLLPGENGNQVGIPPRLDPAGLQDHGGPTQTIALLPGSPAIDGGRNDAAAGLTTDQRGEPFGRLFTTTVDVGAYELHALVVNTTADENDGISAGRVSLRDAVAWANANPGADRILFHPDLAESLIPLTLGQVQIMDDLTITGLGSSQFGISGAGAHRIFLVDNADAATSIKVHISGLSLGYGRMAGNHGGAISNQENLTLQGCNLINNQAAGHGGAIYNLGNLTVVDSTISGNTADYNNSNSEHGGGIYTSNGTLTVVGSTIFGNRSYGNAGGIFVDANSTARVYYSTISKNYTDGAGGGIQNAGTLYLDGAIIANNTADYNNSSGEHGGGIYSSGTLTVVGSTISDNHSNGDVGGILNETNSTATVYGSTITGNSADGHGGGILNRGTLSVVNSVIRDNEADVNHSGSGDGGGIYNVGPLSIENTTIAGNRAYEYGGGIVNGGTLELLGSTIASNFASYHGGGIHNSSYGTAKVHNSTIFDNSCGYSGGGIINRGGVLSVVSSTIANNIADSNSNGTGGGGGIRTTSGFTTLHNTIVADNVRRTVGSSADDLNGSVQTVSSYNLIGGNAATTGGLTNGGNGNKVGIDPLLDPAGLQNHGGLTQIVGLLPGSPAINAGRNDLAVDANSDPLEFDQRESGFPRIVHAAVDIGAFEVQNVAPIMEAGADQEVNEGSVLNLLAAFTDDWAGVPHTATINWGDGTAVEAGLVTESPTNLDGTVAGSHVYADNGTYRVTVTVTDDGDASAIATFDVTVSNVAPTATFSVTSADPIIYGETVTVAFTAASDASSADTAAGFRYAFATSPAGFDGVDYASGSSTEPTFNFTGLPAGTHTLYARIMDQDDGYIDFTVDVTVSKAPLTVTADEATKVYGQPNPAFTASYHGFVLGEDSNVLGGMLNFTTTATESSGVGTYPITLTGLSSTNYDITFDDATLTITTCPITVTADAQTKVRGTADPALTYTYIGTLVGPDEFTGTLDRVAGEDIGTYAIGQGTLALSANYNLTYVGDDLTILPPAPDRRAGDANRDGYFNTADLVQVLAAGEYEDGIARNSTWAEGDWNGDFEFDTLDLVLALQHGLYEAIAGDSNRDGKFDTADLVQVLGAGEYEDGIPFNSTWEEGDWDGDSDFGTSDLVLALRAGQYELASQTRAVAAAVDWLFAQPSQKARGRAFQA